MILQDFFQRPIDTYASRKFLKKIQILVFNDSYLINIQNELSIHKISDLIFPQSSDLSKNLKIYKLFSWAVLAVKGYVVIFTSSPGPTSPVQDLVDFPILKIFYHSMGCTGLAEGIRRNFHKFSRPNQSRLGLRRFSDFPKVSWVNFIYNFMSSLI